MPQEPTEDKVQADTPDSDFGEGRGIRKLAKIWKWFPLARNPVTFPKSESPPPVTPREARGVQGHPPRPAQPSAPSHRLRGGSAPLRGRGR